MFKEHAPAETRTLLRECGALLLEDHFVYAERLMVDGRSAFELRRGFAELVAGQEVLVVDDVVNTRFSIGLVIEAVRAAWGSVRTAATWINRGNPDAAGLGVEHFVFLDEIAVPAWPAESCPVSIQAVPVNTRYAHGAEFLEATGG